MATTEYNAETAAREMARCINVCDITMCCLLGVDPAEEVQADGPPMSDRRRMELARQLRQYDSGMQWMAYTQFYASRYEECFREEDLARDYEQEGAEERAERQRNKSRERSKAAAAAPRTSQPKRRISHGIMAMAYNAARDAGTDSAEREAAVRAALRSCAPPIARDADSSD